MSDGKSVDCIYAGSGSRSSTWNSQSLHVESGKIPKWAGGMVSFDQAHVGKHEYLIPGFSVGCITFSEVLDHSPNPKLDLL
jgi:hypothetical protein